MPLSAKSDEIIAEYTDTLSPRGVQDFESMELQEKLYVLIDSVADLEWMIKNEKFLLEAAPRPTGGPLVFTYFQIFAKLFREVMEEVDEKLPE